MKNVLILNTSLFGSEGASSQLNQQVLQALELEHGKLSVTERDLTQNPLPYFDAELIAALGTASSERTADQASRVALADELISELKAADALIVAAPMYNFGVPAQLKTWLDYVARAGVTFKYTENGPVGLLNDKPVYITATRGGQHKGSATDNETPFLTTFFNFVGLKDLRFVYAEGLNMGQKEQSFAAAKADIEQLVHSHA